MSHQKLAMCIQTRYILTKTASPSDAILRLLGRAPARRMPVGLKAGLGVAGVGSALAAREMLIRQLANNVIKNTPEVTASGVGSQVFKGISNAKISLTKA